MWPRRKYRAVEVLSDCPLETDVQRADERSLPKLIDGRQVRESDHRYLAPPRHTHELIIALDSELSSQLRAAARAQDQTTGEFITELLARGLNHEVQRARVQAILEDLTPRERQVVWMTGRGQTNRQIGEALVISPETVKTHLRHALGKLGLRSKTELRLLLLDLGIRWWEGNPT